MGRIGISSVNYWIYPSEGDRLRDEKAQTLMSRPQWAADGGGGGGGMSASFMG